MIVPPDWIDANGHMTEARYLTCVGNAVDAALAAVGLEHPGHGWFTAETHLFHLAELRAGDTLRPHVRLLAADRSRLHVFVTLAGPAGVAATCEQMLLHVDRTTRLTVPVPHSEALAARLAEDTAGGMPPRAGLVGTGRHRLPA